jgi:Leucine-rich repeat (LRR) protein
VIQENQKENKLYLNDRYIDADQYISIDFFSDALKIKQIEWDTFANFHYIKELNINKCLIDQIDSRWFISVGESLKTLSLNENRIVKIRSNDLLHLEKLEELSLNCNGIDEIEPNSFKHLKSLKKLDLSFNRLKSFNSSLFVGLVKLEELNLSDNRIDSIHSSESDFIDHLRNLTSLDLSYNQIESVDLNAHKYLRRFQ